MSSEEDFSLVLEDSEQPQFTLEGVKAQTADYKKKHQQLEQDQLELTKSRDDHLDLARKFGERVEKLTEDLKEKELMFERTMKQKKAEVQKLNEEELELLMKIQEVEKALKEESALNRQLKEKTRVFTAVPTRKVAFKGSTAPASSTPAFDMESEIVYPMDDGTALITFEEEEVARNILERKRHHVDLGGDCSIVVEARPVQLMMPQSVELVTAVCPHRVLVSDLPRMDTDTLLDKLELYFCRSKNGGGEVDFCEMMEDSWTVAIKFLDKDVAARLAEKEFHEVELKGRKKPTTVRVTPFLNGNITDLQTRMSVCTHTVLLTGIPPVMEQETLQDMLEIHFQKMTSGGGEIEHILYNPQGQEVSAVFEGRTEEPQPDSDS